MVLATETTYQLSATAAIGTTVTFVAHDGQSPTPTATQVAQTDGSSNLTLFSSLFPTLIYPLHAFDFWSTQPGGGGENFLDGAAYSFLSPITLYAQWIGPNHTVTFAENSSSSDSVEASQVGDSPTSLTLFHNLQPTFSKPNYIFRAWNTKADGSGTSYNDGAIYNFASAVLLYAQWLPVQEAITFSSNSGKGSVASMNTNYGSNITLPSGANLSKVGFKLVGWNTNSLGTGTEYRLGQNINVTGSETLYANWSRLSYIVEFATPGAKGKVAPITVLAGNSVHLRPSAGLAKPGFTFAGWFSPSKNGMLVGKSGSLFTPSKSLTLYAQWKGNPFVGLEFSDNGGAGHIPARHARSGLSVVVPSGTGIHRGGFLFRGWASSPRAPGPTVRIGARLVLSHTRILYALWRRQLSPHTPQVLLGSVGIFAPNSTALTSTMRHYIASLAIGINQHNRTLVILYGYATSKDSAKGSALLSLQRALAVEKQLNADLARLNDVGVTVRAVGEGRLSNSVLASFRNVEVFSN